MSRIKIIKPQKLHLGDTVGIISPSAPVPKEDRDQFERGVKVLEDFGLKVKLGQHVFDQHFYSAGTREARIEDFHDIWKDPEVKMILMSLGGTTAIHLLDELNYKMIQETPKIFAGISDGTTLLNAIFATTGLVTYHGPDLLFTFGRKMTSQFRENFRKTFFDGKVGQLKPNQRWEHQEKPELTYNDWYWIKNGSSTGVLVGGHSRCLCSIILAGYAPNFQDKILFLEGTDDVAHLDRQFTALRLNGVFSKISGLILGWFEDSGMPKEEEDRPVRDLILEVTKDYSFPILEIGELGHNIENYTFPIGCKATIDSAKNSLSIDGISVL